MSDNDNPPSKQTSNVPLKKETVRVTLKAADAPSASPGGAPPAPAAPKPTVAGAPPPPSAPRPPTPSVAVPTATVPTPAPTIPLRTVGAPGSAPAPAPTIKLNTPGGPGAPTVSLKPAGAPTAPGATIGLPKATVQLQPPTKPLISAGPAMGQTAALQDDEEETEGSDTVVKVLSVLGFAAALAVVAFQLMTSKIWISAEDGDSPGEWSQLF